MFPTMDDTIPHHKPSSLRSVASNSSMASGGSLTRRARTRTRSRTLTGGSPALSDRLAYRDHPPELPFLDKALVQATLGAIHSGPSVVSPGQSSRPLTASTEAKEGVDVESSSSISSQPTQAGVAKATKASKVASTLPPLTLPSNPPRFARATHATDTNMRDSVDTHMSSLSSSLYPPSTSTGPDSPPSPRSLAEQDDHGISSYDPDVEEIEGFDGDDVSYRLRLLVKNSYFLPPAHSKPSPSHFASLNTPKKPARATTPTFLDLFRGKSKSKPGSPNETTSPFDNLAPALRTTSDATMATGYTQPPRTMPMIPAVPPLPSSIPQERSARVVVVREKMDDLVTAAKQAEEDMKARSIRREQERIQPEFDGVIDPTDAVDLPPPSAAYPFAVQASALHGLGVQESIGAALLADNLPPSPMSSLDPEEEAWRKALLHAAVGHSLSNSPDTSGVTASINIPTPLPSPKEIVSTPNLAPTVSTKRMLGQRILSQASIDADVASPLLQPTSSRRTQSSGSRPNRGRGFTTPDRRSPISRPSNQIPVRAETPAGPHTPLSPPPRRNIINPLYSLSQTDISSVEHHKYSSEYSSSSKAIRRTVSSPMLSDAYEMGVTRHAMSMTPPPIPRSRSSRSASRSTTHTSFDTSREQPLTATDSHYSDDEEAPPRPSMSLSVPTDGRPSLSEYSQPSPTASAFQDALNGEESTSTFSFSIPQRISVDRPRPSAGSFTRYSTMSPPPRVSSSLANIALSPPPRSSSFHYNKFKSARSSTSVSASENSPAQSSDLGYTGLPVTPEASVMQILDAELTTPPFPLSERRGNPASVPLSLDIPVRPVAPALRSAPPPASPIAFFDSIQAQPNAMDDLESSDESDTEEGNEETREPVFVPPRAHASPDGASMSTSLDLARPPIMRLGNHSSPHISSSSEEHRPKLPFGVVDPRKPISNVPPRAPFFSERKSDQGHAPNSPFDFYLYAAQHPPEASGSSKDGALRRPATAGGEGVRAWQSHQRAHESARKLDGMLIQHMEAEKDTIKRIATTLHQKT